VTVLWYSIVQMSVTGDAVCAISRTCDIHIWSLHTAELIWSSACPSVDWPKVRLVTSYRQTDSIMLLLGNKLLLLHNLTA